MEKFWRISPWICRLLLLAVTVLFTRIAWRYLSSPVEIANADEITLGSIMAISRLRVGFGAFPLAIAAVLLGCLLSARHLLTGLAILTTTIAIVTAVRLLGIAVDGSADEALKLLRVEGILLVLSIAALLVERARRRRLAPE
jgi:hypothetical protein